MDLDSVMKSPCMFWVRIGDSSFLLFLLWVVLWGMTLVGCLGGWGLFSSWDALVVLLVWHDWQSFSCAEHESKESLLVEKYGVGESGGLPVVFSFVYFSCSNMGHGLFGGGYQLVSIDRCGRWGISVALLSFLCVLLWWLGV